MPLYRLALERPVSTLVGAIALVVLGGFSLLRLPVSLLPTLERPTLVVLARAASHPREEMLSGVVEPLEARLAALPGLSSMRSEVEDGLARIVLDTGWQTDADRVRIDAARLVDGAARFALDELSLGVSGGDPSPIVEVAVLGGESGAARAAFVRQVLLPELARLPGAGRVEPVGLCPLRAIVRPQAAALAARGITAAEIIDRLAVVGRSTSAGRVRDGAEIRPLLARESVTSLSELRSLPIPIREGPVPLADLAEVALEEVPEGGSFRWNGEDGVLVRIFRAPQANAVALARVARERVAEVAARARGGIRVSIASDRSREVSSALAGLGWAALAGIGLGALVLRFMLGRWSPTLALAVIVPASVLISFAAFHLCGIPLNVISLSGLALAAGMLVDNSIVVLEAVETARSRGAPDPPLEGTRQVALAVVAGSLTTIAVFVPLLYLGGLARAFFGEQAFSIAAALGASLLLSLTLTPVLAGRSRSPGRGRSPGLRAYLALLDRVMRRPAPALAAGAVLTVTALATVLVLERELLPAASSSSLRVEFSLPPDLSPPAAEHRSRVVEEAVRDALTSAPVSILAVRGLPDVWGPSTGETILTNGAIDLEFPSVAAASRARTAVSQRLAGLAEVDSRVAPRPTAFTETVRAGAGRWEILVSAADERRVERLAERVAAELAAATGLYPEPEQSRRPRPAFFLRWNETRLAGLGVERSAVDEQVRAALGPVETGRVDIEGVDPAIRVEATTPLDWSVLPVAVPYPNHEGTAPARTRQRVVPLGALARVEADLRAPRVQREDGRFAVRLIVDRDAGGESPADVRGVQAALRGVALAADESVSLGGEALELARSFSQLRLALVLSLVLVFLTLAALYESLLLPLVIMTTVPVAAAGAFAALAATGQSLNILSFLGLILLGGIVVNNAIVLVDRIERLRAAGAEPTLAVRGAAAERYRPILMTTATTLLGMLPLAVVPGVGVELQRALSISVIGGLTTSTFASLLLVPALHRSVERFRRAPVRTKAEPA